MTRTTVSSRDFTLDLANAKRAVEAVPVLVTERGFPAYALLKIDDSHVLPVLALTSLSAAMDASPGGDFELEPPVLGGNDLKPLG